MTATEYALLKSVTGDSRVVVRVVRENKRHAWVEYPSGDVIREIRSETHWRFPTKEEAEAMRDELASVRRNGPAAAE